MTAKKLGDVMDALGTALNGYPALGYNVYDYPVASMVTPCVFLGVPDSIEYDTTYARGVDSFTIPMYVVTGTQIDQDVRDALATYADGTVFKASVEAITTMCVRCTTAEFVTVGMGGVDYSAVKFTLQVAA